MIPDQVGTAHLDGYLLEGCDRSIVECRLVVEMLAFQISLVLNALYVFTFY